MRGARAFNSVVAAVDLLLAHRVVAGQTGGRDVSAMSLAELSKRMRDMDTPGLVMIAVRATRIEYWDGEESGEIAV